MRRAIGLAGVALTGTYLSLPRQKQQDVKGLVNSSVSAVQAGALIATTVLDYMYSLRGMEYDSEEYHKARSSAHTRTANKIYRLSVRNRGIYFKVGQYIGNLERIIPHEFTDTLKVLQDSAPPLAYPHIRIVLDTDLPTHSSLFTRIEPEAIAAASLAQVHVGYLESGEKVAVKIQYPFLRSQTRADFKVIRRLVRMCNWILKWQKYEDLDFLQLWDTFHEMCSKELNFDLERQYSDMTRRDFAGIPQVYVPKVYPDLSGERVLTMEFVEGIKINNKEKLEKEGLDVGEVSELLIRTFARMIFTTGNVHCDPHPGNILIRKKDGKPELILLDHGFYRFLSPRFQTIFCDMWIALVTFDYSTVRRISKDLGLGDYFRYLPLILTHRTMDSQNPLGSLLSTAEKRELHRRMEITFSKISRLLQLLPPDLLFVIRTSNLVALHNMALGGAPRKRLEIYTEAALEKKYGNLLVRWLVGVRVWTVVFLFERVKWLYRWIVPRQPTVLEI